MSEQESAAQQETAAAPIWERLAPKLTVFSRPFPAEAVALAEAHWDEVAPHLVSALEQTSANPEPAREGDHMLHIYAMFLLAQHRDQRAFAPLLRITALPEDALEDILGDVITDGLGRCLASTCGGDADMGELRATAQDDGLYLYARNAAQQALLTLVMEGDLAPDGHRDWLVQCGNTEAERLRSGSGGEPTFLAMVVADLADIGAGPVLDSIRGWYADRLVDAMHVSLAEVEADARLGFDQLRPKARHEHYVHSTVEEMAWWHCFQPESRREEAWEADSSEDWAVPPHLEPYRREEPKIGRNEPCLCGSGKKYKKCCGAV